MSKFDQTRVVISGVGALVYGGEGSRLLEYLERKPKKPALEEVAIGLFVEVGRLKRLRHHPFRHRFEKMSQLDAVGQFAFIATGHALDDAAIPAPDPTD